MKCMTAAATKAGEPGTGASKLLGLEAVRFTCAFAILLWHYEHFYRIARSPEFVRAEQPLHALFGLFYDYGLFGVQLFWGISGFIFFWKYGQAIADGMVGGMKFFWLRFSRLYPLHIATLLLVAALQPLHVALTGGSFIYHGNTLAAFLLQLGMATDWGSSLDFSFNGPVWSVSAEVFVYALFFFAVRCFGMSAWLIAGAIAASLAGQLLNQASPALVCVGYFFAGGAAARVHLASSASGRRGGHRLAAAALFAAIVAGAWAVGALGAGKVHPFAVWLAMPPLLFLAAQDWRLLERWEQPIQLAGNLTYASYMCHFPLQLLVAVAVTAGGIAVPVASPLFLLAYLGLVLIISKLVFERFERPAQAWIRAQTTAPKLAYS
jgi:peptidoglycan/LPS O-acetylase OafA/YrhL